jgi:U3 small nucleolar RNA-associated protein 14
MLEAIEKFSKSDGKKQSKNRVSNQGAVESAFSSVADSGSISLSALLQPLSKSKEVSALKQQLDDLEASTKVPKYVEKVVAERIERSVTYDNSKEDMAKWKEFASIHRNSKTLDLAQDRRSMNSYRQLVNKFEPTTDLEREVQMVLISSKNTEEDLAQAEMDELSARDFDPEEVNRRQSELAKVKALLFYEQLKRNRINKIKSKTYHRILKRKKQNADKHNVDLSDDENADEDEVTKHIKERMSLKHQNTSKWAKMALTYGKGNKSLRYGISQFVDNDYIRNLYS